MCGIVRFLPGQMMDEEKLFNLAYNNWHSYGLVTKADGRMEIKKVVPESGEIDPKEIWALLKKDQDIERILHCRHNTAGVTDLENCHPFDVFYQQGNRKRGERQIVFMHNGTMSDYKSKTISSTGMSVDDNTGASDTKNFVEQVLIPMTQADYGSGPGDLSNPVYRQVIQKFWPYGNRGILIANDQPSFFLGEWKELADGGSGLKVSNTDYFDKVTRGPEFTRRKAQEEAEKSKNPTTASASPKFFSNLKDFDFDAKHGFFKLSESPCNILNDWEIYDRQHAVAVGYIAKPELMQIYEDKTACIDLMDWVFTDYALLYKEFLEVTEKHDKATKRIAGMADQLTKLGNAVNRKVG